MLEWFGEFFATLPEVLRALYQFGDPANIGRGWVGLAIMALWFGPLFALPLWIAKITYGKREWVSATMGVIAGTSLMWWLHGVIPHGWIQFVQSNANLLEGPVIPASMTIHLPNGTELDVASNLYGVITESVLMGLMVGAIAASIWLAIKVQQRLPKTLASGEDKPEGGGYR
ncbi:MAG: hypothetical protein WD152_01160 [Nitriliruptoraceae bacterium]